MRYTTTDEVAEIEHNTIQRSPHDEENPYAQILTALLEDENISPNCRWLICYLLKNRNGWKINIAQIVNHVKKHLGRDKVYKIIEEAMEAGYMMREIFHIRNKRGGLLKRCRYYVSERPKFKKVLCNPENQEAGNQDLGNQDNKQDNTNKDNTNNCSVCPVSPPVASSPVDLNEKVIKKNFKGQDIAFEKNQLYTFSIQEKNDWTREEIEEAWKILVNYSDPVRDCLSLCSGTIKNLRIKKSVIREKKPCKTKKKSAEDSKLQKPLEKSKSVTINGVTSEIGMQVRPFANWKQNLGLQKQS